MTGHVIKNLDRNNLPKLVKLPEDWKMTDLGEVAQFINGDRGKNYPNQEEFCKSGIPFVNAGHIQDGSICFDSMNYISEKKFNSLGSGKLKTGDIIYCLRGSLGKTAIVKQIQNGAIASSLVIIRPSSYIKTEYLYYFLTSPIGLAEMRKYDNGSSQPNLSAKSVKSYKIPLPPIEEQRRIAAILDQADAVRRKRQEAIRLTEELLRATFLDMFGDPNNSPHPIKTLDQVCTKITDGAHFTPTYVERGIPFLRVTDIQKDQINWNNVKYIPINEHQELIKRCHPQKGDILYSKNGTIGIPKIVDWDREFSIFVSLALLSPKKEILMSDYLESFLNTPFALRQAISHTKTGTVSNLHLVEIRKVKLPIPEI